MSTTEPDQLDLSQPRTVGNIIDTGFRLLREAGVTVLTLTAIVVVPYQVLALLVVNASTSHKSGGSVGIDLLILLVNIAVIVPLVSALQMQVVVAVAEGERPRVGRILRQALAVLPHVAAAVIIAAIGITLGFICLIIPGIILAFRWAVVAQTAAFEATDWPTSLRRGANLTQHNYLRIFRLALLILLIDIGVQLVVEIFTAAGQGAGDVAAVIAALLISSFGALCLALLYFDLRVREQAPGYQSPTMVG
jgi:hypothetical protein